MLFQVTKIQKIASKLVLFWNGDDLIRPITIIHEMNQNGSVIRLLTDDGWFEFNVYTIITITDGSSTRTYTPLGKTTTSPDLYHERLQDIWQFLVLNILKGCCCDCDPDPVAESCNSEYSYVETDVSEGIADGRFTYVGDVSGGTIELSDISFLGQDFERTFTSLPDGTWLKFFDKTDVTKFFTVEISNYTQDVSGSGSAEWDAIIIDGDIPSDGVVYCFDYDLNPDGGSGAVNIYNSDGTLLAKRTMSGDDFDLALGTGASRLGHFTSEFEDLEFYTDNGANDADFFIGPTNITQELTNLAAKSGLLDIRVLLGVINVIMRAGDGANVVTKTLIPTTSTENVTDGTNNFDAVLVPGLGRFTQSTGITFGRLEVLNKAVRMRATDGSTTNAILTLTDVLLSLSGAALNTAKAADVASAATTSIGAILGNFVHVTGTTTITSLGTSNAAGNCRLVTFDAALTLTHNATSLILPGGANITTAAGDSLIAVNENGASNWRVLIYQRASGASIASVNLYNSDGTILLDRTVSGNGKSITWNNLADEEHNVTSSSTVNAVSGGDSTQRYQDPTAVTDAANQGSNAGQMSLGPTVARIAQITGAVEVNVRADTGEIIVTTAGVAAATRVVNQVLTLKNVTGNPGLVEFEDRDPAVNIYNSNGNLTSDRTLDGLGAFDLTFQGLLDMLFLAPDSFVVQEAIVNFAFTTSGGNPSYSAINGTITQLFFGHTGTADGSEVSGTLQYNSGDPILTLYAKGTGASFANIIMMKASIEIGSSDAGFQGAIYSANYSANFVARSLVDKGYVDALVASGGVSYTVASGTDNYTASPTVTLVVGKLVLVNFTNANTTVADLDLDGGGALSLTKDGAVPLAAGDITAGTIYVVVYDGTSLQMVDKYNLSIGNPITGTDGSIPYIASGALAESNRLTFDGSIFTLGKALNITPSSTPFGTTNTTDGAKYHYAYISSTGAAILNLDDASSPIGIILVVSDCLGIAATSNITLDAGTGITIVSLAGTAQTYVINTNGASVTIQRMSATIWKII